MNGPELKKEKDKPKKIKKLSTSKLKKKLDQIFSQYIRLKYSRNGEVSCYTCGVRKGISQMQCGHFVSRSHIATRFDERNCRPQCVGCNIFGGGNTAVFATRLESEYGVGIVSQLYREAQTIIKDFPYEILIGRYKVLLEKLNQSTI